MVKSSIGVHYRIVNAKLLHVSNIYHLFAGLRNIKSKESKINRRMDNKSKNNLQPIKVKKENPTSLA